MKHFIIALLLCGLSWADDVGVGKSPIASGVSSAGWASPGAIGSTTPSTGAFTTLGTTGTITTTGGDLVIATAGKELKVKEGSNASMGTAVLVAGTLVVSNTLVTANSRIYLTSQVDGGTPGFLRVSTRIAATSFTILSSSVADISTVAWMIVEPAP